jgi:hypothetical protein
MRLYCTVHGAQKLFAAFGGPGLDQAGAGFDRIGLTPGKPMAALAGATELGGGLLTAAADPAGPLAIMRASRPSLDSMPDTRDCGRSLRLTRRGPHPAGRPRFLPPQAAAGDGRCR